MKIYLNLTGRLGSEIKIAKASNGLEYARFNIAVQEWNKTKGNHVQWFNCVAWNEVYKTNQSTLNKVTKGSLLVVKGFLSDASLYTNMSGNTMVSNDVTATSVRFDCSNPKKFNQDELMQRNDIHVESDYMDNRSNDYEENMF